MDNNDGFFSKGKIFAERPLAEEMDALVEGLMYVSESDNPIQFFAGDAAAEVSKREVIKQTEHSGNDVIEESSLENFFNKLTTVRDRYGEVEIVRAKRFGKLQKYMEASLRDLTVFRIGKIQVDIYIVGLDKGGRLAGIKTKAIET